MKKLFAILKATGVLSSLCLALTFSFDASAQNYPFPQNVTYNYGIEPSSANHADALSAYNAWKAEYVVSAPCGGSGAMRVKFDDPQGNNTVSEGIGYGMLLAAYAGDKPVFDGLWKFYEGNLNGNGVMHWKVNSGCGVVGANGASDAELDVAMALYVADWQWGGYMSDCQSMVNIIRNHEVDVSGAGHGRYTLKPGDQFGGHTDGGCGGFCDDLTNPSYFSPAYYRVFANYVDPGNAAFWNKLADDGYAVINLAKNNSTGLVPDWCRGSNGNTNPGLAGSLGYQYNGERFFFDAIRTPFRSAIDYLWFGTPEAKTYCELVSDWVISTNGSPGTNNMGSGYHLNGSQFNSDHSNTFVGCFAVTAMATDRFGSTYSNHVNNAYNDDKNTPPPSGQYFNATLKAITLFVMTGNFYLPPPDVCAEPDLGVNVSLCDGNKTLNTGLLADGSRTFLWKRNGITVAGPNTSANTYLATQSGVYEVTTNESGCIRKSTVEVYPATPTADFTFVDVATQIEFHDNSTNGVVSWSWDFDDGSPLGSGSDPVHNYANPGLYNVTLTVQDTCGNMDNITKQVTIGNPGSVGGWVTDDFTKDVWYFPNPADAEYALTTTCSEIDVAVTSPGQYSPFGFIFAPGGLAADPQDLSNYPFVRMKVKTDTPIDLRIDLGDNSTNCGGNPCSTSETPTWIDLNSNVGDWHIITLDFTGKFTNWDATPVDSANIAQITFSPGDGLGGLPQTWNGTITFDWIIAGFENIDVPAVDTLPVSFCQGGNVVLDPVDCHADSYLWSTGETTSSITVTSAGTYCVDATNFGGTASKCIEVTEISDVTAGFAYVPNGLDVVFTDGSTGATAWAWDFGGDGVSSLQNPSHTFSSGGTYAVCLDASNPTCVTNDTTCQMITVVEPCDTVADAGSITGSATVCAGDGCVSFSVPTITNATTYNWTVPTGAVVCTGAGTSSITVDFAAASSGNVTVFGSSSCDSGASSNFAVAVNADANTSAITGSSSVCEGASGEIYSVTNTAGSSYSWGVPTGASITAGAGTNSITVTFGSTSGNVSVTETTGGGCVGTAVNHAVTVNANPTTGSITGLTTVCENQTGVGYSVTNTAGSSYSWNVTLGDATIASGNGTNNIMVNFGTAASTIEVVETNAATCVGSTEFINVTTTTCIGLTANFSAAPSTICEGETVTFTDASTGTSGGTVYSWDFGAGATPPTANTAGPHVVTYATSGIKTVTLDLVDGASNDSFNSNVTVDAAPATPSITGSTSECENEAGVAYSVTNTAGSSYSWSVTSGDATIASGNGTNAITVNFGTVNSTIEVTETNAAGCTSGAGTVSVTMTTCAVLAANFNATPTTICEGETVTFTDASTGTSGGTVYSWDFGAGATPATANTAGPHVVTYSTSGVKTVTLDLVDGASNDSHNSNVTVNAAPNTSAITGANFACSGTTGEVYTVTNTAGSSYIWSVASGDATLAAANGTSSMTIDFGSSNSTIQVIETNAATCVGSPVQAVVAVSSCVGLNANFTSDSTTICSTSSVQFFNASTGTNGSTTYAWDFGVGATPANANTEGPHTVSWSSPGAKTVELIVTNPGGSILNGGFDTYAKDDFAVSPEYQGSGNRGVNWWANPSYTLIRDSLNDRLQIDAVNADPGYDTYGVGFGDDNGALPGGNPYSINLSGGAGAANIHLVVTNTNPTDSILLAFSLQDINGNQVEIYADTSTAKNAAKVDILPGETKTVDVDLTNGWRVVNWNCANWPIDCPTIDANFDFTQVTGVGFHINGGAGSDIPSQYKSYTGTVYFEDFELGIPVVASADADTFTSVITVNTCGPGLTAAFTPSSTSVCEGETVTFTDASTGTSGGTVYSWDFGAGATPPTANTAGPHVVTYATSGVKNVTLDLVDGADNDSEVIAVTVNASPTTSAITGSATACSNATGASYSVTNTVGSTYAWSVTSGDASIVSGQGTSSITVDFGVSNSTIEVVETSSAGCAGTAVNTSVTVSPCSLDADFTASTTTVCQNVSMTYTDNTVGASGSATYAWDFGAGATPPTAVGIGPHTVSYSTLGFKDVSLTVTDGAADVESKTSYVEVTSQTITDPIVGPNAVACNATGIVYSTTNNVGSTYSWNVPPGATLVSGQGTSSIVVDFGTINGSVTVVEIANGCLGTTELLFVSVCVGVGFEDDGLQANVTIQPNPFEDAVFVQVDSDVESELEITFVDAKGVEVLNETVNAGAPVEIGQGLPAGMYVAVIKGQTGVKTVRLVKL